MLKSVSHNSNSRKPATQRSPSKGGRRQLPTRPVQAKPSPDFDSSLLRAALEAAANAVIITDRSGIIEWTNHAFTELTGYTAQEVIGKTPRMLRSGKHDPEFYRRMWETILSGQVWSGEVVNRRKDGTLYSEEMTITPVRSTGKNAIIRFVAIKQDITARKALERELQHSQKMEAIGTLAGGIAHDFNNLLSVIAGCTGMLDDHCGADTTLTGMVDELRKAVHSATGLTSQLLALGRKQALRQQALSLNAIVSDTGKLLRRVLPENIALRLNLSPRLGRAMVDRGQMQQVLLNLAVNARDAMPNGGLLTIATQNVDLSLQGCGERGPVHPGPYVKLTLRDTGTGMDRTTLSRAFEPFFTTKPPGTGTGLGLSTVYGLVKQNHGHIFLSSAVDQGTTADVYLPKISARAMVGIERRIGARRSKAEILLVEDNRALRRIIQRSLEKSGYAVISAETAREALTLASTHKRLALLITDIVMPGMDGTELARRLAKVRELDVIYMSGHADALLHEAKSDPHISFIKKPFEPRELVAQIRRTLTRHKAARKSVNSTGTRRLNAA